MSKFEALADSFFKSITTVKHASIVEKLGLQDTTINISKAPINLELDFAIKETFIFNREGVLILQTKFNNEGASSNSNIGDSNRNSQNFAKLNKIVKNIFSKSTNKKNEQSTCNPLDILPVYSNNDTNFHFHKLYLNNQKVFILSKCNLVLVSIFAMSTKSAVIKLYSLHIFTAFINFIGESIEAIVNTKHDELITNNTLDRSYNYIAKDMLQIKIFELYFMSSLTNHFERLLKTLMKKEEMYLTYIKFKNLYVLDINTGEVLCDMMSLRDKKAKKLKKNERLWQEITYHSHMLMKKYKADNNNKYDGGNLFYNFVKIECTSTYPRLTIIIKFLPILNGVTLIHVYSQNKLSRYGDETSVANQKSYKEIEIIYGSDLKNTTGIEFRYTEPKKLKEIERFFLEFYISTVNKFELFFNPALDLRYFETSMILVIDDVINSHKKISCDTLLSIINTKLYELYLHDMDRGRHNMNSGNNVTNTNMYYQDMISDSNLEQNNTDGGTSLPINPNFLNINRQSVLKDLFQYNNFKSPQGNVASYTNNSYKARMISVNSLQTLNINLITDNNNSYVLTMNEVRENTLMLSNIQDNQSKMADNELSFDLTKQLSEISNRADNDEENPSYRMNDKMTTLINYQQNESVNEGNEVERKLTGTIISVSSKESVRQSVIVSPIYFKNKIVTNGNNIDKSATRCLNKLQQSISNINKKIQSTSSVGLANNASKNTRNNNLLKLNHSPIPMRHLTNNNIGADIRTLNSRKSEDNIRKYVQNKSGSYKKEEHEISLVPSMKPNNTLSMLVHNQRSKSQNQKKRDNEDVPSQPYKVIHEAIYFEENEEDFQLNSQMNKLAADELNGIENSERNNQLHSQYLKQVFHTNSSAESEVNNNQPNIIGTKK